MSVFVELSLVFALAAALSFLMRLLRQPLIIGYIITGVIAGPLMLDMLHSRDELELFSKIGISILLFIVGLNLNPKVIHEVGLVSLIAGIGQVVFTSVVGFFITIALGFDTVAALYVAIALTFSSTIIILRLLSDRGDTDKLYGKIAIGVLLVQDLVATIVLLVVSSVGSIAVTDVASSGGLALLAGQGVGLIIRGTILLGLLVAVSRVILPRIIAFAGGNQEALFIFSIAWGFGLSSLFHAIGFSVEVGALAAGVSLAASPFVYEIGARMKPLRDFFILIFFVLLGAQMMIGNPVELIGPVLILSSFVLVGNPLIVFWIMNFLGYRTKTAFFTGLTVAQISEFSLVLVALGLSLGHISEYTVSVVTLVGIITIAGSTYLILYADTLYHWLAPVLEFIALRKHHHREPKDAPAHADIVIFGYDRVGHEFVDAARKISPQFLVVDYDPQAIKRLSRENVPFRYGDAEDVEFLNEIGLGSAQLVISSLPSFESNRLLLEFYRRENPHGICIVIAHTVRDAQALYAKGATYVVMPHHLGAHHAALLVGRHGLDERGFLEERNTHLSRLARSEEQK